MTKGNSGQFLSGEHRSPATEFTKGMTPWNKGIVYSQILGEKHPRWSGGKPNCLDCNKKLGAYTSKRCRTCYFRSDDIKKQIKNMCSNRGEMSGDKHHNWKGGVSSKDKLERSKFRQTLQRVIFIRDNYTCQICDQYGGHLQVDHIKKWSEYPELRFDKNNCRTLCMACHYYITFKRKLPSGVVWGHNLNKRIAS